MIPATRRRPLRKIAVLVVGLLAVFAASAQAHTLAASATCTSVTLSWTSFGTSGNTNGGKNTPEWTVAYTPTGGATVTQTGKASFTGSSFQLKVTVPSGNGKVTASSKWSSSETRDGNTGAGSSNLTIANCPTTPPPVTPPVTPPTTPPTTPEPTPTPVAPTLATPTLSTTGSADVVKGSAIHDTALLGGGANPTGTLTYALYALKDTTCARPLLKVTTAVNGAGSYVSPPVKPASGAYQWVASYGGDAANNPVSGACNDPAETTSVATRAVRAACVTSTPKLRGIVAQTRTSFSAHLAALGVKRVTFYLDGRKLKTQTKAAHKRFSVTVRVSRLGYGAHRVKAKVTMTNANCASAAVAGTFVRVKSATVQPSFTG